MTTAHAVPDARTNGVPVHPASPIRGPRGLGLLLVCPPSSTTGLREPLDAAPGTDVVAVCGDASAAVAQLRSRRIDVVVLDLAVVADNTDLGYVRELLIWPERPPLLLVASGWREQAWLGALAPLDDRRVLIGDEATHLLAAAARVACPVRGDPRIPAANRPRAPRRLLPLTEHQSQVLDGLHAGRTSRQISKRLDISPERVNCHVRDLLRRYGATNRRELLARSFGHRVRTPT